MPGPDIQLDSPRAPATKDAGKDLAERLRLEVNLSREAPPASPPPKAPEVRQFGDTSVYVHDNNTAFIRHVDGAIRQGFMRCGGDAFVQPGVDGRVKSMLRRDGSEIQINNYGPDGKAIDYFDKDDQGNTLHFEQDKSNPDKVVAKKADGSIVERYSCEFTADSLSTWKDAAGKRTLVFGDGAVEHAKYIRGLQNGLADYAHLKSQRDENEGILAIDADGRLQWQICSKKEAEPGNGSTDRYFGSGYIGNTGELKEVWVASTKGQATGQFFVSQRFVKYAGADPNAVASYLDKWNVPVGMTPDTAVLVPVTVLAGRGLFGREHYRTVMQTQRVPGGVQYGAVDGWRGFMEGTKSYSWLDQIGPEGHKFTVAHINEANGTVSRADRAPTARDGSGNVTGSTIRYWDAYANLIGAQPEDQWGVKGQKITRDSHPGATFDLAGNISYTEGGAQHKIHPDGSHEIVSNGKREVTNADGSHEIVSNGRREITYGEGSKRHYLYIPNEKEEITDAEGNTDTKFADNTYIRQNASRDVTASGLLDNPNNISDLTQLKIDDKCCLRFSYTDANGKFVTDEKTNKHAVLAAYKNDDPKPYWERTTGEQGRGSVTNGEFRHYGIKDGKNVLLVDTGDGATLRREILADGNLGRILDKSVGGANREVKPGGSDSQPAHIVDSFSDGSGNTTTVAWNIVPPGRTTSNGQYVPGTDGKGLPFSVHEMTVTVSRPDSASPNKTITISQTSELFTGMVLTRDATILATNINTGKRVEFTVPENNGQVNGTPLSENEHLLKAKETLYAAMMKRNNPHVLLAQNASSGTSQQSQAANRRAKRNVGVSSGNPDVNSNWAETTFNSSVLGIGQSNQLPVLPIAQWSRLNEAQKNTLAFQFEIAAQKVYDEVAKVMLPPGEAEKNGQLVPPSPSGNSNNPSTGYRAGSAARSLIDILEFGKLVKSLFN